LNGEKRLKLRQGLCQLLALRRIYALSDRRSHYAVEGRSERSARAVPMQWRCCDGAVIQQVRQHTPLHSSGMPGGRLRRCAPSRPLTQTRRRGAASYKARRFGSHGRMTRLAVFSSGNQSVRLAVSGHGVDGQSGRGRLSFVWRTPLALFTEQDAAARDGQDAQRRGHWAYSATIHHRLNAPQATNPATPASPRGRGGRTLLLTGIAQPAPLASSRAGRRG